MKKITIALLAVTLVALTVSQTQAQMKTTRPMGMSIIDPHTPFKPKAATADLAAVDIFGSVAGDIVAGTAKPITVGVVKNVDKFNYSGDRHAMLQYRINNGSWKTFANAKVPNLKPGATFQVVSTPAQEPPTNVLNLQTRLVISAGDAHPANDVYLLVPKVIPVPK